MTSLISFENNTKPKNILGTTCRTFGNRCLRYWLLHLKNENARDATVTLKTYTIMPLDKQVALVRCWPQFLSVCLQRFQNKKQTFSCLHPEEIRSSKGKVHTFQTGTTGVVWSNSNGYGMVCYGDIWWVERGAGGGVRCEDGGSGQLAAAVKSPFECSVGRLTPLRTLPLPSPLLSSPGCTWRETKRGTLGHLIDCDISNWSCGSSVNDREWICIHNVQ